MRVGEDLATFRSGAEGKCFISSIPGKFKNFSGRGNLREILLGAGASEKVFLLLKKKVEKIKFSFECLWMLL